MCGIYTITNIINNKMYVGYAYDFDKRWYHHKWQLNHNKHHNKHLQDSWNKYGEDSFIFEILELCDEVFLLSQENYWVNMLNVHDFNYGYNIESTNPTKRVIRRKKGFKLSPEHISKLKHANSTRIRKPLSEEVRKKMSITRKGRVSPRKGCVVSEETRKKISNTLKGHTPPNKGKSMSQEQKDKIRATLLKRNKILKPENNV